MKKAIFALSFIVASAVVLVSFDKARGPKEVAKTWLTSFYHLDFEGAKKVSSTDTKALLTQLAGFTSMIPDSVKNDAMNIVITIGDSKEEGEKATVNYTAKSSKKDDAPEAGTLKLVKESGEWMVLFTKEDANGNADNPPAKPTLDQDQTGEPPKAPANKK